MDEALALPSEKAARIALRTQQVIAHETGVANSVDPLGGSWLIESLTSESEREAYDYFHRIEDYGGVIPSLRTGFQQREIAEASYHYAREIESGERTIVGVNDFVLDEPLDIPILEMDREGEKRHRDRLSETKRRRDSTAATRALRGLEHACRNNSNVMPPLLDAVKAYCSLQEVTDVMRDVFGTYQEPLVV
jgi:methylmalonyl-CoA mutase N-terminal domain/subunit